MISWITSHHSTTLQHLCWNYAPAHSRFLHLTLNCEYFLLRICSLVRSPSHQNWNLLSLHPFSKSPACRALTRPILEIQTHFELQYRYHRQNSRTSCTQLSARRCSPSLSSEIRLPKISFHRNHVVETNDTLDSIDHDKMSILEALDISVQPSVAFDTLGRTFGLSMWVAYVIFWIHSYLSERSSHVKVDTSSPSRTPYPLEFHRVRS